jgi:hypothetical protein
MERYEGVGLFVGVVGVIITFYGFYLVGSTILESAGIALLIVGLAFILTVPEDPSKSVSLLAAEIMQTLESFSGKLPPGTRLVYERRESGQVVCSSQDGDSSSSDQKNPPQSLSFTPIGATLASKVKRGDDYQQTLKKILVEETALASGCDALIDLDGGYRILVQEPVTGFLESTKGKQNQGESFDSPLAQICASVLACCGGEKVFVKEENKEGGNIRILLGLV